MFKNYIKIAIRNLWRHKGYSLINLIGLAVSLTTCLLIFLYVQDELSYDDHWKDAENIYRLENRWSGPDWESHWAATSGNFVFKIAENYPEVVSFVKIQTAEPVLQINEQSFYEKRCFIVDSLFFDVFDFKFIYGNNESALNDPFTLVLTESLAKKYFGNENPMNKEIQWVGWEKFLVTGVIEDVPRNSHLHFDLLLPMSLQRIQFDSCDEDGAHAFYSYIKTTNKHTADILREKVKKDAYKIFEVSEDRQTTDRTWETIIQPIGDIHLNGHAEKEIEANGNVQDVYIFISVAIFLLFIACINYMNLATARAVKRGREIGIRKVVGARRKQIALQFLGESFLMTLLALLISIVIAYLLLPYFNTMIGRPLNLNVFQNALLLEFLVGVLFIGTALSGLYPAFFLAGFSPVSALKSNVLTGRSKRSNLILRRILVITQFTISVLMIISVLTVQRQLNFMENKDIGFDKSDLLVFPLKAMSQEQFDFFIDEMNSNPQIESFGTLEYVPGVRIPFCSVEIPELARMKPERYGDDNGKIWIRTQSVWLEGTIETLGLQMESGRWFSDDRIADDDDAFILNETAVKDYGLIDPIGKEIWYTWYTDPPKKGTIIGVVKDFHYADFKTRIEPLMIHNLDVSKLIVRFQPDAANEVINDLKTLWDKRAPDSPFEYYFLDESFGKLHENDIKLGVVTMYFAFLALIIACLGLFGLALFMIEQRTKEIAIRKIMGCSVGKIIVIVFKEFFWLTIISNIVAWYPAYYFMNKWLGNFVYRIDISFWSFGIAFLVSFLIIMVSVSYKTIVAANANPVKYMRYE
jgi:putative ABC transport system permease protein